MTNDCTVSGKLIDAFLEPTGVVRKSRLPPTAPLETKGGLGGGEYASEVVTAVSSMNPNRELELELALKLLLPMKSSRVGVYSIFLEETRDEVGTGLTHSAAGEKKGEILGGLFVVTRTGCLGMNNPLPLSFSLTEDTLEDSEPLGATLTVDVLVASEVEGDIWTRPDHKCSTIGLGDGDDFEASSLRHVEVSDDGIDVLLLSLFVIATSVCRSACTYCTRESANGECGVLLLT